VGLRNRSEVRGAGGFLESPPVKSIKNIFETQSQQLGDTGEDTGLNKLQLPIVVQTAPNWYM
jgi:hypothetical protein